MIIVLISLIFSIGLYFFPNKEVSSSKLIKNPVQIINKDGSTIKDRIKVPKGFERASVQENSYGYYLRTIKLNPHGVKVKLYDGRIKINDVYEAVLDFDVDKKDLQQCADAAIRLRSEYLYSKDLHDKIHFNFINGFRCDYNNWKNGNRISVNANAVSWVKKDKYNDSYEVFRKYLDTVFTYAGSLSLSKEKKFLIVQSYMPAQDIHLFKNMNDKDASPWYSTDIEKELYTPEWKFTKDELMRFE